VFAWTFSVGCASFFEDWLRLFNNAASFEWIAFGTGRASAFRDVIGDDTLGARMTIARISATLTATGQLCWTVVIDDAFRQATGLVRIAFVAVGTVALSPVDGNATFRIGSAHFVDARILALAVDAGLR